ncbi:hypothetical protein FUAX_06510 [Fulvitalea axinellae]|uniref:Outer membrane protein beta-barrel domain-containing protein n=1 Tax=Fulvitalea axinellae TaxID=1182444 RepID=A0AAU9C8C3_9BACT|nr:hypothetical protein FUAX_06510 [Fulvitalea axinellae]
MKKLSFYLLMCLCSLVASTDLLAQKKLRFGMKAGVAYSSYYGDNIMKVAPKTGFQAGFLFDYRLSEKWAIQPEFIYSVEGIKFDNGSRAEVSLGYINMPIIFKYYATEKLSLQAGPKVGFLTWGKIKEKGGSGDASGYFKDGKFDLQFGVGYDLMKNLAVNVRYTLGVTNAMNYPLETGWPASDFGGLSGEVRSSVLQVNLVFRF